MADSPQHERDRHEVRRQRWNARASCARGVCAAAHRDAFVSCNHCVGIEVAMAQVEAELRHVLAGHWDHRLAHACVPRARLLDKASGARSFQGGRRPCALLTDPQCVHLVEICLARLEPG